MSAMTKEEIIRQVIMGMEAKKHRQSMQRIVHSACRTLKIQIRLTSWKSTS